MSTRLKNCPFCGQQPNIRTEEFKRYLNHELVDDGTRFTIACDTMKCTGHPETGATWELDRAIKAWNTRTPSQSAEPKYFNCEDCRANNICKDVGKVKECFA